MSSVKTKLIPPLEVQQFSSCDKDASYLLPEFREEKEALVNFEGFVAWQAAHVDFEWTKVIWATSPREYAEWRKNMPGWEQRLKDRKRDRDKAAQREVTQLP